MELLLRVALHVRPPRFQNSRWINIGAEVEQASDSLIMAHENRIIQS